VLQQILPLLFEAKEKRDYTQQKALYDELLDIDEQSFGNFSLECSADHNNLGRVFTALGDKFSAMQHLQLALNIQTALLAPNDPILQSTRKLLNEVSLHFSR
jgi:tetratricopeptide (TPR) repeat protein